MKNYKQKHSITKEEICLFNGTETQNEINEKIIAQLNKIACFKKAFENIKYLKKISNLTFYSVSIAYEYNVAGICEQAIVMIDFADSCMNVGSEIGSYYSSMGTHHSFISEEKKFYYAVSSARKRISEDFCTEEFCKEELINHKFDKKVSRFNYALKRVIDLEKEAFNNQGIRPITRLTDAKQIVDKSIIKKFEINSYAREALSRSSLLYKLEFSLCDVEYKPIRNSLVNSVNEISNLKVAYCSVFDNCDYSRLVFNTAELSIDNINKKNYEQASFFSKVSSNIVSVVKHGVLGVARGAGEVLGCLSDGCKGILYACKDNEVVRTAGFFLQNIGYGLEASKVDILNCIKKAEAVLLNNANSG